MAAAGREFQDENNFVQGCVSSDVYMPDCTHYVFFCLLELNGH